MEENVDYGKYEQHYNDDNFWSKIKGYATKAGAKAVYSALKLYYGLQSPQTPQWAKGVIVGALGYFILPADLVPDLLPVAGFTDDLSVMLAALATVAVNITPEIKAQARKKMSDWFGDKEITELGD